MYVKFQNSCFSVVIQFSSYSLPHKNCSEITKMIFCACVFKSKNLKTLDASNHHEQQK
jgi:hypothetical protein